MTNKIYKPNPLLQPIHYNGQIYFTSHHLHQYYKSNDGGKYELLKNFNRLIRSIEAYQNYVDQGDIVELDWQLAKATGSNLEPVFESISYKPIMLINATAQIALTHHLDDEISKQVSVKVNKQASESMKSNLIDSGVDPVKLAKTSKAFLSIAKAFGLKGNQAVISADRATRKVEGHSPLALLEVDLVSESKEILLNPTELGNRLGLSARQTNVLLLDKGYQTSYRDSKNEIRYELTDKGKQFGDFVDAEKSHGKGTPVKQLKWKPTIIQSFDEDSQHGNAA